MQLVDENQSTRTIAPVISLIPGRLHTGRLQGSHIDTNTLYYSN